MKPGSQRQAEPRAPPQVWALGRQPVRGQDRSASRPLARPAWPVGQRRAGWGWTCPPTPCIRGAAAGGQDPLTGSLLPSRAHCAFLRGHEAGGSPHCRKSLGRWPPQGLSGLQGTTACSLLRPPHLSMQGTYSSLFSSFQRLNNPTHCITAQIPF